MRLIGWGRLVTYGCGGYASLAIGYVPVAATRHFPRHWGVRGNFSSIVPSPLRGIPPANGAGAARKVSITFGNWCVR